MTLGFKEENGLDIDDKYVNQSYLIDNFPALITDKLFDTIISTGYNNYGNLGINSTTSSNYSSFQTVPSTTNIKQIAANFGHTVVVKTDGTLISVGYNAQGQLGINSTTHQSSFQTVPSITNVKQVSCGQYHTFALKTDGTLISCGMNNFGQLGINSTTSSKYSSFQTVPSITNVKQVYSNSGHAVVLKTDGTLMSCGYNVFGQLGIGSTTNQSSFQTVPSITNVKQVSCGYNHTVALKTDGSLISCGYNTKGQLGINSTTSSNYSAFQTVPSITNVKQVAAGYHYTAALKTDGTLISCGYNSNGQLGINSTTSSNYSAFQTVPSITNVKQIACGNYHTVALKTNGTLISCGQNNFGQLGINSTTSSSYSSFQTVPSITNVKQVATQYTHTVALKTPENWI